VDALVDDVGALDTALTFSYDAETVPSRDEGDDIAEAFCEVFEKANLEILESPTNPLTYTSDLCIRIAAGFNRYLDICLKGRSGGVVDAEISRLDDDIEFELERVVLRRWRWEDAVETDGRWEDGEDAVETDVE
jgi:hypothetical protein